MHRLLFWVRLGLLLCLLLAFTALLIQGVLEEHRRERSALVPLQAGADPGIRVLLRERALGNDVHASVPLVVQQAAQLFTPDNPGNPDWQLTLDPQALITIMPHPTGGFSISSAGGEITWPVDRLRLQAQHQTRGQDDLRNPLNRNPRRFEAADRKPVFAIGERRYRGSLDLVRISARQMRLINSLPMEAYIAGVVPVEMSPSWPLAALKSQAVCARSYGFAQTIEHAGDPFDVVDSVADQAYHGQSHGGTAVALACAETHGEILSYQQLAFPPFFHASSGGRTAAVDQVFLKAKASDERTPLSTVMPSIEDPYARQGTEALGWTGPDDSRWRHTVELRSGDIREAIISRNRSLGIDQPVDFVQDLRVLERVNGRISR
ncbi:MAG: SpoIID/LytB domain-containing protein, partial [Planctomycetota bacterium]